MKQPLRYDELAAALARLGFKQEPAEYHGALCGALCVREPGEIDPLRLLEGGKGAEGGDAAQALTRLRGESAESFVDSELGFEPLLPDDEEELPRRVRALGAWCEGFLYGLATGKPLSMKSVSPELKEIVQDFTEFTRAGVGDEDDGEIEENAYAELVEYIRVGAQLIFMELHERAPSRVH
jgi:uncharacterized protein YgfB (UPF0149 family)